ncbi:hypothetical protein ACFYWY_04080 [Streptomyces sp. NPDC002870]
MTTIGISAEYTRSIRYEEVLLSRYAKCLDGRQEVANRRIEDLLREYE